jgi:hypothetical protein
MEYNTVSPGVKTALTTTVKIRISNKGRKPLTRYLMGTLDISAGIMIKAATKI